MRNRVEWERGDWHREKGECGFGVTHESTKRDGTRTILCSPNSFAFASKHFFVGKKEKKKER